MKVPHFGVDLQGPGADSLFLELVVSDYQLLRGPLLNLLLEMLSDISGLEFLQWGD